MVTKRVVRNIIGIAVFILSVCSLLFAFTPSHANPVDTSTDLNINITPSINLSLTNCAGLPDSSSSSITLNVSPTSSGTFKSNCQDVSIQTNTPGYKLLTKASSTNLTHTTSTATPKPTIPSTTNTFSSPNTIANDTWGYAVANLNNFDTTYTVDNASNKYAALTTTDTQIYTTTTFPAPRTDFKFFYGTRLSLKTPAGGYKTTITYSAIGDEPEPVAYYLNKLVTKNKVTTMQGLISDICNAATYDSTSNGINDNNTVTLIDTRNNQQYNVRKMADNKCWMIDNLKLELTIGMTLTPQDTNVTTDTTVYFTQDGTSSGTPLTGMTGNFTTSGYMTRYGSSSESSPSLDNWRQANPSNITNCLNNTGTNTEYAYSLDSKTKCGYLYNYYTATAGSQPQSAGAGYASDSICPAGWHLPYNTSTNDFAVLNGYMAGLGASSTDGSYFINWLPDGAFQGSLSGIYYSGFQNQGYFGNYWSARASSSTHAYTLYFNYNHARPGSLSHTKYNGYSVRCMI